MPVHGHMTAHFLSFEQTTKQRGVIAYMFLLCTEHSSLEIVSRDFDKQSLEEI